MEKYKISLIPKKVPYIKTRYRTIRTKIPTPRFQELYRELEKYEAFLIHDQLPVVWDRAKDFQIFDNDGNRWIDFTSSIFLANAGHSNPLIVKAIRKQLNNCLLHSYNYITEIRTKFLKKLIQITPSFCQKVCLFSAGTEASECAIMLARTWGHSINEKKIDIVSHTGSMHGISTGAEMLRGDPKTLEILGYSDSHVHRLPFPYPWDTKSDPNYNWTKRFEKDMNSLRKNGLNLNNICCFFIEAFQGWGAIFYPKEYIKALEAFAKKHNALIIIDEIQGGFGRTGKMFSHEHYGIEPDLICVGKGFSGSLPLSGVLGRKKIMDLPKIKGSMHSTHSGNPLSCAAGLANLEAIEQGGLVKESARKGKILFDRLNAIKKKFPNHISCVLGKGLLAGIIFKNPDGTLNRNYSAKICEMAMRKGLLLVHTSRSIKISPPLTIADPALIEGLDVLEECIRNFVID